MNKHIVKELDVKISFLSQAIHEKSSFEVELEQDTLRLDKMKEARVDQQEISEQEDMVLESKNMIMQAMRSVEVAYEDLKTFHDKLQQNYIETPSYMLAQELLLSAQKILNH